MTLRDTRFEGSYLAFAVSSGTEVVLLGWQGDALPLSYSRFEQRRF